MERVTVDTEGNPIELVPQYFVRMLDDPKYQSADMVGSMLQFYNMAETYTRMSVIAPKVENLKAFLANRTYRKVKNGVVKEVKRGDQTNLYRMAAKLISMNVYDVKNTGMQFSIKGREINLQKLLVKLKGYGTTRNLGLNMSTAMTGFFTALSAHITNMVAGRYYNFTDAGHAFKDLVYDLMRYGMSVGSRTYRSQ
jgi:hypothetical protein